MMEMMLMKWMAIGMGTILAAWLAVLLVVWLWRREPAAVFWKPVWREFRGAFINALCFQRDMLYAPIFALRWVSRRDGRRRRRHRLEARD